MSHIVVTKSESLPGQKVKHYFTYKGAPLVALYWKQGKNPVIYDQVFDQELSKYAWYVHERGGSKSNVVCNKKQLFMYAIVACMGKIYKEDHYIEHIGNTLDNRLINLKVSLEKPILTRASKPRYIEGYLLPKYLNYDKSTRRFILSGHPWLRRADARPFVASDPSMSLQEQYDTMLGVLAELDAQYAASDGRAERSAEYKEICDFLEPLMFFAF